MSFGAQIRNLIARAVVNLVDDGKHLQIVQLGVLADETVEDIERFQNYGFTSNPATGAEAVVLFVNGQRDHGLVVSVDDRRYRIANLASGEVAVYDKNGSKITLKANGDIDIAPASGNVNVTGTLKASVDVQVGSVSLKNHVHTSGSFTTPSGAVTGTSGTPI
jgi:phage gp45-like